MAGKQSCHWSDVSGGHGVILFYTSVPQCQSMLYRLLAKSCNEWLSLCHHSSVGSSPPPTSSTEHLVNSSLSAAQASLNFMDYHKHLDMSAAAMYDFKSHPMAPYPAFPGLPHLPPTSDRNGHMMMRQYHSNPQQGEREVIHQLFRCRICSDHAYCPGIDIDMTLALCVI